MEKIKIKYEGKTFYFDVDELRKFKKFRFIKEYGYKAYKESGLIRNP